MTKNLFQLGIVLGLVLLTMVLTVAFAAAQPPAPEDAALEMPDPLDELLAFPAAQPASQPDSGNEGAGTTGSVRPPGTFDLVLLGEDIETFRTQRWQATGLWHHVWGFLDAGLPYSRTHSPVSSVWYGQDGMGDYDTGAVTWGTLRTSQTISIPISAMSVTVSFWSWEETEQTGHSDAGSCDPPPTLCPADIRALLISGTITHSWQVLWASHMTPTVEQDWHQVTADISGYRGQDVKIGFLFHSVNADYNQGEGWYLDDISIVAHGMPLPGYDLTDSWVQAFAEDHPGPTGQEVYLDRVQEADVATWRLTDDGKDRSRVAVAAHPVRHVPVAWMHSYTNALGVRVSDVEYATIKPNGAPALPVIKITDHSDAVFPGVDARNPVLAVDPVDSRVIFAWTHCQSCPVSLRTRVYDVHYGIHDDAGGVVAGPLALSHNTDNLIQDYQPAVETFANGNALIAWRHRNVMAIHEDILYTVVDSGGDTVHPVTNLTGSPTAVLDIHVARLADGNLLLVWSERRAAYDLYYAVLASDGSIIKAPTALTSYGDPKVYPRYPEPLGMANGNSIVTWTEVDIDQTEAQIRILVLDDGYNVLMPPTLLPNPYSPAIDGPVSMVVDESGAAVLTWEALSYPRLHLTYARLDDEGNVLTGPAIYRQTRGTEIRASVNGYGVGELPPYYPVYLPLVVCEYKP